MNIIKQHIILNLIRSGRYSFDPKTGDIISHVGKKPRALLPLRQYTGYLEYQLDIGFNETIIVYGQGFAYLATWLTTYNPAFVIDHIDKNKSNNRPDNLRCITHRENTHEACVNMPNRGGAGGKKTRLPVDQRAAISIEHISGVSFIELSKKYGITRQTVSRICGGQIGPSKMRKRVDGD